MTRKCQACDRKANNPICVNCYVKTVDNHRCVNFWKSAISNNLKKEIEDTYQKKKKRGECVICNKQIYNLCTECFFERVNTSIDSFRNKLQSNPILINK